MKENDRLTEEFCVDLLHRLKKSKLDPVLGLLSSPEGSQLSFKDIIAAYASVEQGYIEQSRGAKDVCAKVFYNLHPVSASESLILFSKDKSLTLILLSLRRGTEASRYSINEVQSLN